MRAGEWDVTQRLLRGQIPEKTLMIRFIVKSGFWLVLLCALPLLLAIILGLFPWFGTEGQEYLRQLHGYSGLALVVVSLVHLYVLMTAVEIPVEQLVKEEHH
jgi:succinate dehydrogenase hydrophobic anchor subunit